MKAAFHIDEHIISNNTIHKSKIFQYLGWDSEKHRKDKHGPDFDHRL